MGDEALSLDEITYEEHMKLDYPIQRPLAMCDYSMSTNVLKYHLTCRVPSLPD